MRYTVDFEENRIIIPSELEGPHANKVTAAIKYFKSQGLEVITEEDYADKMIAEISTSFNSVTMPLTTYTLSTASLNKLQFIDQEKNKAS